jgi:glycosyltransferase involved in cell wall biosynthesis
MKIFVLCANENWVVDHLAKEWIENNKSIYTNNIHEADTIWILSYYVAHQVPLELFKNKNVITTIHHIVPWKMNEERIAYYKFLNGITTIFHTLQEHTKTLLEKYVDKPIVIKPFWTNQNLWKHKYNKAYLREQYGIPKECYLIGSFQRDTEGDSIASGNYSPKLEKGPDIFIDAVKALQIKHLNIRVLLTGRCREYIMSMLQKNNIKYSYFEMIDYKQINDLYNCLDLYIVSSRVEGGPRAINECAANQTPIVSTDVGVAKYILHKDSIFNMHDPNTVINATPCIDHAYNNVEQMFIPRYFTEFNKIFR